MVLLTLEQPGVKAPGTAKITIFFPLASSARLTLFVGRSSKRSTLGIESPT